MSCVRHVLAFAAIISQVGASGRFACTPMGRYWGVSWVKYRGHWSWLAQRHGHGGKRFWRVGFDSEDKAAKWLAKQMAVPLSSLRKSGPSVVTTSVFRGVVLKQSSSRSPMRYVAQVGSGEYLGTFATEMQAAKAVARRRGVGVKKLRRKAVSGRRGSSTIISGVRARALFRATYPHFKSYAPGDYEHMMELEDRVGRHFKKDQSCMYTLVVTLCGQVSVVEVYQISVFTSVGVCKTLACACYVVVLCVLFVD